MSALLEEFIQQTFIEQRWTLSIAESCTGGALAARLTALPGCSRYFLGSLVTYSNDLKVKLLQVDKGILEKQGAVSGAVVAQMALGVQQLTNSDYSLAVSGIAGPEGGSPQKPVGTIWAAVAKKGQSVPFVWSFQCHGNRQQIISQTTHQLLNQLSLLIKNAKPSIA